MNLNNKKLRKFKLKGIKINRKKLYFGSYGLISLELKKIPLNRMRKKSMNPLLNQEV